MNIRALDTAGDWVFGHGLGDYLAGLEGVVQDIDTALSVFLGECFWDTTFGVDWLNLIGGKAPIAQQNIILQCRQIISSRSGVIKINSVDVQFSDYRRSLHIVYSISTIYGKANNTFVKGFNHAS